MMMFSTLVALVLFASNAALAAPYSTRQDDGSGFTFHRPGTPDWHKRDAADVM